MADRIYIELEREEAEAIAVDLGAMLPSESTFVTDMAPWSLHSSACAKLRAALTSESGGGCGGTRMQPDKRGAADDLPAPEGSEGHASAERDVALASLGRIKAAAESDAAFDTLGGLRHFLIHECMAATEALKGTKG